MKTHIHTITRALSLGVAVALTACASVQRAPQSSQPAAPAAGKALVTFYRESKLVGMAVGFNIRDGGVKIGGLPNGTAFDYQAAPGPHRFTAATESTSEANLTVEPGRRYYIRGDVEMGLLIGRPRLTIVAPEEGEGASRGLRRVVLRK